MKKSQINIFYYYLRTINRKCIKKLRDFLFQNKTFIPEYNPA